MVNQLDDSDDAVHEKRSTKNPASCALVQDNFVDGQWWTSDGMAVALGTKMADERAVRFYASNISTKGSRPSGDTVTKQVMWARRCCVARVLDAMARKGTAELDIKEGTRFYKILKPVITKGMRVERPIAQTKPADSTTGLTVSGILSMIAVNGGKMDFEDLLKALDSMFVPTITDWWLTTQLSEYDKGRTTNPMQYSPEERTARAKRFALSHLLTDAKARFKGQIKITKKVIVEYRGPKPSK